MRSVLTHTACAILGAAVAAVWAWNAWGRRDGSPAAWTYGPNGTALVQRVVDGDTIVLSDGMHVRYLGINAPETRRFVKDPAPLAAEATERNSQLVTGKRVRLVPAPNAIDVHGRLLADVYVLGDGDGAETWVQEILVSEGLARAGFGPTPAPGESKSLLAAAEAKARGSKAGVWGVEDSKAASVEESPYCGGTSDVYHLRSCPHARRSQAMNLRYYPTQEDAAGAGRRPCKDCAAKKK